MNIKNIYPVLDKKKLRRSRHLAICKLVFLLASAVSVLVNLLTGGKAWSAVVLMSLYMIWSLILAPDLIEYNRISQAAKAVVCICLLLILTDLCLSPGWAGFVVPIVCAAGLLISGVLFLSDIDRQKQNMQPLLQLVSASIAGASAGLLFLKGVNRIPLLILLFLALLLFAVFVFILKGYFLRELQCRWHMK